MGNNRKIRTENYSRYTLLNRVNWINITSNSLKIDLIKHFFNRFVKIKGETKNMVEIETKDGVPMVTLGF